MFATFRAYAGALLLIVCLAGQAWDRRRRRRRAPTRASRSGRTFSAPRARNLGPAVMSGRITCLDAVNSDPRFLWVGSAGGGVWKSRDGGVSFESVFDEFT